LQLKLKSLNDPDAMVVVARDAGYEISAEDLQRAQVELTENELEDVSGGAWSFFHSPWHKKTNFTC